MACNVYYVINTIIIYSLVMGVTLVSRNDFNRPHYYLIVQEFHYNLKKGVWSIFKMAIEAEGCKIRKLYPSFNLKTNSCLVICLYFDDRNQQKMLIKAIFLYVGVN